MEDLLGGTALLGFAAAVAGGLLGKRSRIRVSVGLTLATCICGFVMSANVLATGHPVAFHSGALIPLGGMAFHLDRLGALFTAVAAGIGVCAMVFRLGYTSHGMASRTASCMLPLFVTSLLFVPAASNVTTFLYAWEAMAVTSLLLVLVDHRQRTEVQSAGQWYGVLTQFGAASILVALVLLGTHAGGMTFVSIASRGPHVAALVRDIVFMAALVGFGSKAGAVPLHVWLPKAHAEAPGPVSALMSAAMVNLGVYGILRVGDGLLGGGPAWWWLVVMGVGGVSALFGALHSSTSADLKRLLAYSTTDNMGLVLVGVGASGLFASTGHRHLALIALVAALLHVVFHAVFKGSLFLSASSIQQATGVRDLDRLGGLMTRMPTTSCFFLLAGLALAAMPPLSGFVSEWLLLQSMLHGLPSSNVAVEVAMPLGVAVLALTGGLTALAAVKAVGIGLLGRPRSEAAQDASDVPHSMKAGAGILAALCLLLGVAPFLILPSVIGAARSALGSGTLHPVFGGMNLGLAGAHGMLAPALLALGLAAFMGLVAGLRRLVQRGALRRAEAWGCGRELQTAQMQCTASSFAEPLVRIFDDVLAPAHDLEVSHKAESSYYIESASFHASVEDAFDRRAYRPMSRWLGQWGEVTRRVPNGSVHRYLAFGLVAVIVVLVVLA